VIAVALASLASAVVVAVPLAWGQKPEARKPDAHAAAAPKADGGDRHDPDNVTALSLAMKTLLEGNEKYAAKDYTGAIDVYKRGITLAPRNPLGHYLMGEAYLATGNLGEAEAAFKQAEEVTDSRTPIVRSHVLFAVADVYERQKKWEPARAAWERYNEHAAKVGADGGAAPASGAARFKAVDDWMKLDKQYELVRQRIAAERDGGANPPAIPDAGPPKGPAKK